uniref:Uncharacterized protein n=1 Tax=Mycena chlorophos TaxID=658473 RepID=A0ABQ0LW97_MYCCL|nr:predicted protein [Mycena chlorophos]
MASKRDATNPLLAAANAKKPKKKPDPANTTLKRKHAEEQPGGLLIVRANRSEPVAGPSNANGNTSQASKKFRAADSSGTTSSEVSTTSLRDTSTAETRPVDKDKGKGKAKAKPPSSKSKPMVIDTEEPLLDGTPQAERNKAMRAPAMAAIAQARDPPTPSRGRAKTPESNPDTPKNHKRRNSRGKRVSTSFQGGAAVLPHPEVDQRSFYKHIDHDLPPAEQLRQLVTWSAARASTTVCTQPNPSAASSSKSKAPPTVPPSDVDAITSISQGLISKLLDRRMPLRPPDDDGVPAQGTNTQNLRNRQYQIDFGRDITTLSREHDDWVHQVEEYTSFADRSRTLLQERYRPQNWDPQQPEAGPSRASTSRIERDRPWQDGLDARGRAALDLCNHPPLDAALSSPSPSSGRRRSTASAQPQPLPSRLSTLEFKLNMLHTHLHAARTAARTTQRMLDARFGVLGRELEVRSGSVAPSTDAVGAPTAGSSGSGGGDTRSLLRALSRVDSNQSQRRAAAQAPPGTPRRDRDRTPAARERTPGRDRERTPGR